jgi:hypothetical protein
MQMNISTPRDIAKRVKPAGTRRRPPQPPGSPQREPHAKTDAEAARKSRKYGAGF